MPINTPDNERFNNQYAYQYAGQYTRVNMLINTRVIGVNTRVLLARKSFIWHGKVPRNCPSSFQRRSPLLPVLKNSVALLWNKENQMDTQFKLHERLSTL